MTRKQNMQHAADMGKFSKGTPVRIIMQTKSEKKLSFMTLSKCHKYLTSSSFKISLSYLSKLCQDRKIWNGMLFKYQDESKYITTVGNLKNELWKFHGTVGSNQKYFVSNYGRVKSINQRRELLLNQWLYNNGYCAVKIGKTLRVHRLVAFVFVPNPKDYCMVDHIDGNVQNNHASNLQWVKNQKENMNNPKTKKKISDAKLKMVQDKYFPVFQLNKDNCQILKKWTSTAAVKKDGYNMSYVLQCSHKHSQVKTAYGYIWATKDTLADVKPFKRKITEKSYTPPYALQLDQNDPTISIKIWNFTDLRRASFLTSNIHKVCQGKLQSTQGFKWKYTYDREQ